MSGFNIATILDKKDRTLPKPINNRPGFDLKYTVSYIGNYIHIDGKRYDELFDNEKLFDNLSIIKQDMTPVQWAMRVRIPLQNLLNAGKFSVYHRLCLFTSYGKGKFVNFDYYRPRIHKSHMAICFDCWKLIKIDNVNPKKIFHFTRQRYVDCLESKDLMQEHWDHECNKPKTNFGKARIIQIAYRNYKNRPESLATQAWNAMRDDGTSNDKKFLGLTSHEVKNPQTREQFNQWRTKWIEIYKNDYMMRSSIIIRQYEEYYILVNWISSKKSQLQVRFRKRLLEIEA